jgi:hypothetical protein
MRDEERETAKMRATARRMRASDAGPHSLTAEMSGLPHMYPADARPRGRWWNQPKRRRPLAGHHPRLRPAAAVLARLLGERINCKHPSPHPPFLSGSDRVSGASVLRFGTNNKGFFCVLPFSRVVERLLLSGGLICACFSSFEVNRPRRLRIEWFSCEKKEFSEATKGGSEGGC